MECKRLDNIRKSYDIKNPGIIATCLFCSNLLVPQGIGDTVRTKSFKFLYREIKKDKIRISGIYQEPDRGGIRVTDLNIMFKALKLAWIPRILASGKRNCCTIPNHSLKKMGGLNFLSRCNFGLFSTTYRPFNTKGFLTILMN